MDYIVTWAHHTAWPPPPSQACPVEDLVRRIGITFRHPIIPQCGYTLGTTRSRSFSTKNQHLENRHSLLFNIWQLEHFPCTAAGYATLFLGRCLGISRNIQQFAAADPLVGERQRYSLLELAERMLSSCGSTGHRSFGWTLVAGLDWPMLDG